LYACRHSAPETGQYKQHVDKIRRGTSTHIAALDQPNFVAGQESVRAC
jgi:hypothetical protein